VSRGLETTSSSLVIEVKTESYVVPLLPHLTLKQARGFMSSNEKSTRERPHHSETAKQVVGGLFGKQE
jgi:hypothetical protein